MENMKTVVEFHLDGLSPELENKLREMVSAGKKPADAAFAINKMLLANYMRENSIDLVVAEYSGSGDSGGVDMVTFYRGERQVDVPRGRLSLLFVERRYHKDGDTVKFTTFDTYERSAFERMTDDALDLCGQDGWEVNSGGYGEVRFTLKSPQDEDVAVKITHNAYITEVETNEYDI
jgi:hypothetical protein